VLALVVLACVVDGATEAIGAGLGVVVGATVVVGAGVGAGVVVGASVVVGGAVGAGVGAGVGGKLLSLTMLATLGVP
jgi:hypothetical protein